MFRLLDWLLCVLLLFFAFYIAYMTHHRISCMICCIFSLYFYLAHSANLPSGLYILLQLISFFSFFNDRSEHNYIRIRWTDFHTLSIWTSFSNSSSDVAMATDFRQNWKK